MPQSQSLLANLPDGLRTPLLTYFNEIRKNFVEMRWEPSELNGGKFSEAVYSILEGAITGKYPAKPKKPDRFADACRGLEQKPATPHPGDRSLRVLIPRVLTALYEVRNTRGVGHSGGDVDPNHMDASVVLAMTNWVMAELIRIFHNVSVDEAQERVELLVERQLPIIWRVGPATRILNTALKTSEQVLVLLYTAPQREVAEADLFAWTEYSNQTVFRTSVLAPLHKSRLVEFREDTRLVTLSPLGVHEVEDVILKKTTWRIPNHPLDEAPQ